LILFIFAAATEYSFAEDSSHRPVLKLNDSTVVFPVLKSLFDSGFFSGYNYITQYIPADADPIKKDLSDNLFLTSGLKNAESIEYVSFTFLLNDSLKQNIMLAWDIPYKDSLRQNQSIRNMLDFAYNAHVSSVPDALINTAGLSKAIEKLEVNYIDLNKTEVAGYDLKIRTGFSPTHRFVRALGELTLLTGSTETQTWRTGAISTDGKTYGRAFATAGRMIRTPFVPIQSIIFIPALYIIK
jgi:hypothetical protein